MNRQPVSLRGVATVLLLTLFLGGTVVVSWLAFGGTAAFRGPIRALEDAWPLIYGSQAVFAAIVGFVAAPFLAREFGRRGAVQAIAAAWVGEFLVLFLGGTLFAGELVPEVAWFYWLIGTGGPLQPLAALVGASITPRVRPPQAPIAEARSIRPS